MVTRLDRLARSTRDLLNTLDAIGKAKATFSVLDNPLLDTASAHGQLLVAILGAIATFERQMILARTGEGRARAKANGTRFGRKPTLSAYQMAQAKALRAEGRTLVEIAQLFGVSHSTISRLGE